MKKCFVVIVAVLIVLVFAARAPAVTTYADLYYDWSLSYGSDIPDQSGGLWQPYGYKTGALSVDWWGGFDPSANGIKERMFFEWGTIHDGKGWIEVGPKDQPDNYDTALLSWWSEVGGPGFCRFEARHLAGSPVNIILRNLQYGLVILSRDIDANDSVAAFYGPCGMMHHWLLLESAGSDSLVEISWIVTNVDPDAADLVELTIQTAVEGASGDPNTVTPSVGTHQVVRNRYVEINAETYIDCPTVLSFDRWEGEGITYPNYAQTTVFMDQSRTITAVFTDARQCGDVCHPYPSSDMDQDCDVDLYDFAAFGLGWLECTDPSCDEL